MQDSYVVDDDVGVPSSVQGHNLGFVFIYIQLVFVGPFDGYSHQFVQFLVVTSKEDEIVCE